jgi:hypothetical protein
VEINLLIFIEYLKITFAMKQKKIEVLEDSDFPKNSKIYSLIPSSFYDFFDNGWVEEC